MYFQWAITLYTYHKNAFYGFNAHPPVRISKNISGEMVFSCPPWLLFLKDFVQNPPLECKQLRDTESHPWINIRFQQSDESLDKIMENILFACFFVVFVLFKWDIHLFYICIATPTTSLIKNVTAVLWEKTDNYCAHLIEILNWSSVVEKWSQWFNCQIKKFLEGPCISLFPLSNQDQGRNDGMRKSSWY